MKLTDEAVAAAEKAWNKAYWTTASPGRNDWMRAALEAALPHLEGATPGSCICGTYLDRDGDLQKDADDPSCPVHGEGATPAIDREQIAKALFDHDNRNPLITREWSRAMKLTRADYLGRADAIMALIGGAS